MSNKIVIGSNTYTFLDSQIESGAITSENALIEETLAIDELDLTLLARKDIGRLTDRDGLYLRDCNGLYLCAQIGEDMAGIEDIDFGTPIYYYKDNVLVGKFYKESIIRSSKLRYKVSAISGIGLLDRLIFYGDVYTAVQARTIIASIMNGTLQSETSTTETYTGIVDYVLEKTVGDQIMNGWLAIQSRREALKQTLFGCGASIFKQPSGIIEIKYSQPTDVKVVSASNVYVGGNRIYESPITAVNITEHSYVPGELDQEVELFNSAEAVVDKMVVFNKPCHDLEWNGEPLTSGFTANYAIVSGSGTLTGKEYRDSTRIVREEIEDASGSTNEKNVTDATLVSSANSGNVAKRVANYYANKKLIKHDFVWDNVKPGEIVSIPDPFDEATILTAFVQKLNLVFSNTIKAQSQLVTNWSPMYIGNKYNHYVILDSVGDTFRPTPDLIGTEAQILVFGGFQGGQGGGGSTSGTGGQQVPLPSYSSASLPAGTNGLAGPAGEAGNGVMLLVANITLADQNYTVTQIGTGGLGGQGGAIGTDEPTSGAMGQLGGVTICSIYSSANGSLQVAEYVNPLNGDVYGGSGISGCKGGEIGETITYKGQTYAPGIDGEDYSWTITGGTHATCGGTNGSGAYFEHSGTNGNRVPEGTYALYGADGINSTTPVNAALAQFGRCGNGGHGAPAPSGGGSISATNRLSESAFIRQGIGGLGAPGSNGSNGSDGFVLILYR